MRVFSAAASHCAAGALIDLFASYRYNDNVSASPAVRNLPNKDYTQYLDTLASPSQQMLGSGTVQFAKK